MSDNIFIGFCFSWKKIWIAFLIKNKNSLSPQNPKENKIFFYYLIPPYYVKIDKVPLKQNDKMDIKVLSNSDTWMNCPMKFKELPLGSRLWSFQHLSKAGHWGYLQETDRTKNRVRVPHLSKGEGRQRGHTRLCREPVHERN